MFFIFICVRQQCEDLLHGRCKPDHQVLWGWCCWLLQTQSRWWWGLGELLLFTCTGTQRPADFRNETNINVDIQVTFSKAQMPEEVMRRMGSVPRLLHLLPFSLLSFSLLMCQTVHIYSLPSIFIHLCRVIEALLGQHIPPRPASVRWHKWFGATQFAVVDTLVPQMRRRFWMA